MNWNVIILQNCQISIYNSGNPEEPWTNLYAGKEYNLTVASNNKTYKVIDVATQTELVSKSNVTMTYVRFKLRLV